MQTLVKGIHRLCPAEFRSSHALFRLPTNGQSPEALLIACSELPIDPYSLIPTNFADLYVLQNFGNFAARFDPRQPDQDESVEAALALYPLKDVVVCGHASCGVLRNVLAFDEGRIAEMPLLVKTLRRAERTRRIMARHYGHLVGEPLLAAAIEENVLVQLENLRAIPAVAARLKGGDLHLHGWIYAAGVIFAYDPQQEQFVPLTQ
jgi:carbonic anhydrase